MTFAGLLLWTARPIQLLSKTNVDLATQGKQLLRQAVRINSGARHLIIEGGSPAMVSLCRREMDRVAEDHAKLVKKAQRKLSRLLFLQGFPS
jgi:hypothetical protein